jgi:putative membrane protein
MGIAELVPGVSGGTIAFITGIYIELVRSVRRIGPHLLRLLLRGRIREAWVDGNLGFLILLWTGMGTSVLTFAWLVSWLLEHRELQVWGFFFGLILASALFVGRFAAPWTVGRGIVCAIGVGIGAGLGFASALAFPVDPFAIFLGGAVAICAWILPGVSGSFILLLLGQYPTVVQAIAERDLVILGALAAGCTVGLLLFARLLVWVLRRYYEGTLALLCGFMGGALVKLWPWRVPVADDALGVRPATPGTYASTMEVSAAIPSVMATVILGILVVLGLEILSRRSRAHGISPGEIAP